MMEELILGVDGSGVETRALVADPTGRILGRGLGPSVDQYKVGFEKMCEGLTIAIEGALGEAVGLPRSEEPSWRRTRIAAACFGLAGIHGAEDQERVSSWLRSQQIASTVVVVNDAELILAAGTPDGCGVAVVSGEGSVSVGRSSDGRTARAGGWGRSMGYEGSGYQIAVDALGLATQAAEGRSDAHRLLDEFLSCLRLGDFEDLVGYMYHPDATPHEISKLAIPVIDLANGGDAAARSIVDSAARALAHQVDTVVNELGLTKPPLVLSGLAHRATLCTMLLEALTVDVGHVSAVEDAAQGALAVAHRLVAAPVA